MGVVPFTDDGDDRYSGGPDDPLLEPVQVIGDPVGNYFWVVRAAMGRGVGEFKPCRRVRLPANRVGEAV